MPPRSWPLKGFLPPPIPVAQLTTPAGSPGPDSFSCSCSTMSARVAFLGTRAEDPNEMQDLLRWPCLAGQRDRHSRPLPTTQRSHICGTLHTTGVPDTVPRSTTKPSKFAFFFLTFKNIFIFNFCRFIYVWVCCLHMCMCTVWVPAALRGQNFIFWVFLGQGLTSGLPKDNLELLLLSPK